jgi:hypothetical protein
MIKQSCGVLYLCPVYKEDSREITEIDYLLFLASSSLPSLFLFNDAVAYVMMIKDISCIRIDQSCKQTKTRLATRLISATS